MFFVLYLWNFLFKLEIPEYGVHLLFWHVAMVHYLAEQGSETFSCCFERPKDASWPLSFLLQLALLPDLASVAGQTATSLRGRSWNSTWGRSRPRKANRCKAVWYVNKIEMPSVLLSVFNYSARCVDYVHWKIVHFKKCLHIKFNCILNCCVYASYTLWQSTFPGVLQTTPGSLV